MPCQAAGDQPNFHTVYALLSAIMQPAMQDEATKIKSLYLSQLHALNEWRKRELCKLNPKYSSHTGLMPPAPKPVPDFEWRKDEEKLVQLFRILILLGFFEEKISIDNYKESFRPRFIPGEGAPVPQMLKCCRNYIDLVWVFYQLQYFNAIASKYHLRDIMPLHFVSRKGAFNPGTIKVYVKRIRNGIYQPAPGLLKRINEILF